jgi:hypothetical protein
MSLLTFDAGDGVALVTLNRLAAMKPLCMGRGHALVPLAPDPASACAQGSAPRTAPTRQGVSSARWGQWPVAAARR